MATNEKLKILYLLKILFEKTDKNHSMNATELCKELENCYGMTSDRKTIYSDIERLRIFGIEIQQKNKQKKGYYISKRTFELPELTLLVDAVQASRFITNAKSEELIKKLESLTTVENAKQLHRQVYIYNRVKADNEMIYTNVDIIHTAIHQNRKIAFKYCEWTQKKILRQRKNGAIYQVSPWSLTWNQENYYLVAFDSSINSIRHYRVDKMQEMKMLEEYREGKNKFEGFDLAEFSKKTFGMYGGYDKEVIIRCKNSMAGVIIDRFGKNTFLFPAEEGYFRVHILVSVSQQFFGWLTGIGEDIEIVEPMDVRKEYQEYLEKIIKHYSKNEEQIF